MPRECCVKFCDKPRAGTRKFCELHLLACPADNNRKRIKRCHYWLDAEEGKRQGHRCRRPVIYPIFHGLCSLHHPDQIRKRLKSLEEVVGESEDPLKELQAMGHLAEKGAATDKVDHKSDLDARFERAGIKRDDGARALKTLMEARTALRTRTGDIVRDDGGAIVYGTNLELLLKVVTEFRDLLGLPAQVVQDVKGAGINIQVGIIVPPKKPIPIDAKCVDVED